MGLKTVALCRLVSANVELKIRRGGGGGPVIEMLCRQRVRKGADGCQGQKPIYASAADARLPAQASMIERGIGTRTSIYQIYFSPASGVLQQPLALIVYHDCSYSKQCLGCVALGDFYPITEPK